VKVTWVHPSWRDLVIAQLSCDGRSRRRFLGRCGVHGVVLALSTAGGATGELSLPLLGEDEDWDVITDRVYTLLPELEPGELIALLTALSAAHDDLWRDGSGREADALAQTTLARTKKLWKAAGRPIGLDQLGAWLSLASRLKPRPQLPDLDVTWAELLPTGCPALADRGEVERFTDWFLLLGMLGRYHRRLLADGGIDSPQRRLAVAFVDEAEFDLPAASSVHVMRALEAIAEVMPVLSERVEMLAALARPEEAADTWAAGPPPRELLEEPREMQAFDVVRVLMDL
jgi:hypothetical protein